MASVTKDCTVEVRASAEATWNYIVWEYWPNAAAHGMHSPVRDDRARRFGYQYGRGSGRGVGQLVVTPVSADSCSLQVSWQTLDVGFVVAAVVGGRSEKSVRALSADLKSGIEARTASAT